MRVFMVTKNSAESSLNSIFTKGVLMDTAVGYILFRRVSRDVSSTDYSYRLYYSCANCEEVVIDIPENSENKPLLFKFFTGLIQSVMCLSHSGYDDVYAVVDTKKLHIDWYAFNIKDGVYKNISFIESNEGLKKIAIAIPVIFENRFKPVNSSSEAVVVSDEERGIVNEYN